MERTHPAIKTAQRALPHLSFVGRQGTEAGDSPQVRWRLREAAFDAARAELAVQINEADARLRADLAKIGRLDSEARTRRAQQGRTECEGLYLQFLCDQQALPGDGVADSELLGMGFGVARTERGLRFVELPEGWHMQPQSIEPGASALAIFDAENAVQLVARMTGGEATGHGVVAWVERAYSGVDTLPSQLP